MDRLRLDPGDDELAGLEVAALLDRVDELLVVEVAVAEVEPDDRVAAELGLAERVAVDVVAEVLASASRTAPDPGCACARQPIGMAQQHLGDRPRVRRRDLVDGVAGARA